METILFLVAFILWLSLVLKTGLMSLDLLVSGVRRLGNFSAPKKQRKKRIPRREPKIEVVQFEQTSLSRLYQPRNAVVEGDLELIVL